MRCKKESVEYCGHLWVPHLKDIGKLVNDGRSMARMVINSGKCLRKKRLEWKPRGEKICGNMVAVAKYVKVYTYGRGDGFCFTDFLLFTHIKYICVYIYEACPEGIQPWI